MRNIQEDHQMIIVQKTILITGANRGIGLAMLEEALQRGVTRVYAATRGAFQHPDRRVTHLPLDVTDTAQVKRAATEVQNLDLLVNNAGVAIYDDLSDPEVIGRHLAVNLLGLGRVTQAFLPQLRRSKGAILNNLSMAALAPLPVMAGYSVSKAAALSMTQSLRALLAAEGVSVHAAFIGPTDTDMSRGFEIPKATPEATARGIFDGLENGEEDVFPDPVSEAMAEGWRQSAVKALERQFAAFVPPPQPKH
jgi:NAD(P)-dependent dehydrogenase (short-subunit alcohol dehydrogenase family)